MPGASNEGYAELGRRGGALAARFAKGDESVGEDLFKNITQIAERYLGDKVRTSRATLSGVPGDRDENDLLAEVHKRIFKRLKTGRYVEDGRFQGFVLTIAYNVLVDSLAWRKSHADESLDDASAGAKERRSEGRRPKGTSKNPHVEFEDQDEAAPDEVADLFRKEILNLVLGGLREVSNPEQAQVWAARVLLGKEEKEVGLLYGLKSNTCKSHFRRASIEILEHVNAHPAYEDVPIEGLRGLAERYLGLESQDLDLIDDEVQREALRVVASEQLSLRDLGHRLGQTHQASLVTLRAGIATLAKANVRRVKVAAMAVDDEGADLRLWGQVDKMIACYPKPLPKLRADAAHSPGEGQLAALCQIAVILGFGRDGETPAKTFSDLVGDRVTKDGVNATATALGLARQQLLALLAGELPPDKVPSSALSRMEQYFRIPREPLIAAIKAAASAHPTGQTRGLSSEQRQRYLDGVKRRVLSAPAKG